MCAPYLFVTSPVCPPPVCALWYPLQYTAMGFPEDQVRSALTAASGDGDMALEYLLCGTPDQTQVNRSASEPQSQCRSAASMAMGSDQGV